MDKDKDLENKKSVEEEFVPETDDQELSFEDISGDSAGKIAKVKEKLKAALRDKDEYLAGWQRCRADFVNAKRMAEMERSSIVDSASESFVRDLLPVLDSFDMAFASDSSSDASSGTGWREGFTGIYSKLLEILNKRGLKQIGQAGEKFDINLHEPVATLPTNKEEMDDIVMNVLQKGYSINGRLVRPAKVTIGQYTS